MIIGYLRARKSGPSLDQQRQMLQEAGFKFGSSDELLFIDEPNVATRLLAPRHLVEREAMLTKVKNGDTIIVPDYATLALSETDWLSVLGFISGRGASLTIAEPERHYEWPDVVMPAIKEISNSAIAVGAALRAEQTASARKARDMTGRRGGRPTAAETYGERWDQAVALWKDPNGGTGREISEATGVPLGTLKRELKSMAKARATSTSGSK